jgi:DNA polymerase III subunit delta'
LRPFRGGRKIAMIEDADFLNEEGANCLLKTLEEPPADAVIILVGTSEQRQLPTIRSRCRTIRFASPRGKDALRLMHEVRGIEADDDRILEALELSAGDVHVAAEMLRTDGDQFYQSIRERLAETHPDPISLSRIITEHVDGAGKDASKRRDAMRDVFSMAVQHYRGAMRTDAAKQLVSQATIARLDRSIRALREVDRSANQSTLIECYASDIATATTGDRGEIG